MLTSTSLISIMLVYFIQCINSLRRDCDNEDPMVRGLALRSLTSLRLESIIEYCEQPLEKALTDLSAYVRKTGVMGVLKVYSLRRSVIERGTYIEQLVLHSSSRC